MTSTTDSDSGMTSRPYTSVWSDLTQVAFSQGFIDAGGYRTRYLHAGDPKRPTLLLLHGITGHAEAYVRQLMSLGAQYDVWAIDLIGHGYSAKPNHPLEIPHYVDHVLKFLDAIGSETAHIPASRSAAGSPRGWPNSTPTASGTSCSTPWAERGPTPR